MTNILFQLIKEVFPHAWRFIVAIGLAFGGLYTFWQYNEGIRAEEARYHQWAGSIEAHYFDPESIQYDETTGMIRVRWVRLPKVPACDFTERYLKHRLGREPIERVSKFHRARETGPHRVGKFTDQTNIKPWDNWGEWMYFGDLPIDVTIQYEYAEGCDRHLPQWWAADQRIVYTGE